MSYLSSGRLEKSALKARLLCVVPVITVDIVIHAHVNFNRGWLDRVFLNCGWLDRGTETPQKDWLKTGWKWLSKLSSSI